MKRRAYLTLKTIYFLCSYGGCGGLRKKYSVILTNESGSQSRGYKNGSWFSWWSHNHLALGLSQVVKLLFSIHEPPLVTVSPFDNFVVLLTFIFVYFCLQN